MRDLTALGFFRSRGALKLTASVGGVLVSLPEDYLSFLVYSCPDESTFGFKFIESTTGKEWEGQVAEFESYETSDEVQRLIIDAPDVGTLLAIGCNAGGNYLYLDLRTNRIIDISYTTGKASVVAEGFSEFLDKLYCAER